MAFTNIPNGNLQVGAPLRSVDILALRDNIPAVMNGDTGAPKIKAAAFEGQSGAAPPFAARAWVNFNGPLISDSIRASGNVSTVVRNATGRFTINFASPMVDASYAVNLSASGDINPFLRSGFPVEGTFNTGSIQIVTKSVSGAQVTDENRLFTSVVIFR